MSSLKKMFDYFRRTIKEVDKTWENTPEEEYEGICKDLENKIIEELSYELDRHRDQQCACTREGSPPRVLYLDGDGFKDN